MKDLWNKIKTPIKVGVLGIILSFLPIKALGQETNTSDNQKVKYDQTYGKFGLSTLWSNDPYVKNGFGTLLGFKTEVGKEMAREIKGGLSIGNYWGKGKGDYYEGEKCVIFDATANIIWAPEDKKGDNLFYIKAGFKYRSLTISGKGWSDNTDGIGLNVGFGGNITLGKGWKIYSEIEYDQTKGENNGEENSIGGTTWAIGVSRIF